MLSISAEWKKYTYHIKELRDIDYSNRICERRRRYETMRKSDCDIFAAGRNRTDVRVLYK